MTKQALRREKRCDGHSRERGGGFRRRNGYHGTTMEQIAEQSLMTKGSLYYYFRDKEEILFAVHDSALERLLAELDRVKRRRVCPCDRLEDLLASHIRIMVEGFQGTALALEFAALSPRRLHTVVEKRDRYERAVRSLIEQGARQGCLRATDPSSPAWRSSAQSTGSGGGTVPAVRPEHGKWRGTSSICSWAGGRRAERRGSAVTEAVTRRRKRREHESKRERSATKATDPRSEASFEFREILYEKDAPIPGAGADHHQPAGTLQRLFDRGAARAHAGLHGRGARRCRRRHRLYGARRPRLLHGRRRIVEYADTYVRQPRHYWKYMGFFRRYLESILQCGKPVIARINGMAVGGGNESSSRAI
jgi:AcrR family transcriptional regulator